jgi:hypothetical protein
VFDYANYERLQADYPFCAKRLHFLGALCPTGGLWIDDPYGREGAEIGYTYDRIAQALSALGRRPERAAQPSERPVPGWEEPWRGAPSGLLGRVP